MEQAGSSATAAEVEAPTGPCARHPDRLGRACDRCGTFACEACLRPLQWQRVCEPCLERASQGLPPLAPRAGPAKAAMLASGALGLVNALVPDAPQQLVVPLLDGLLALVSSVLFLRWFHLAVRRGLALGVKLGTTPTWAVLSWFIPFVNLARPYHLARLLAPAAPVSAWQALYIFGYMAQNMGNRFPDAWPAVALGGGMVLGAALAGSRVIDAITTRVGEAAGATAAAA